MAVRYETMSPINAVRARTTTSSGGGSGGGSRGSSGHNYSAEAVAVLNDQTRRDLAYREEQVEQLGIDEALIEIEQQQSRGELSPEMANSLRIQARTAQMRHNVDPSTTRLREAQARQFELENVQLTRQDEAQLQQLTAARARIRERVAMNEMTPAQGMAQEAYIQQQIAPLAQRRTRAGALQQEMEAGMMRQQADERIIQRRNEFTGEIEDWVIDRNGVPQPPRTNNFSDFAQLYQRVAQGMETTGDDGVRRPADPTAVAARVREIREAFSQMTGQPNGQNAQPQMPRIIEGGAAPATPAEVARGAPGTTAQTRGGTVRAAPTQESMNNQDLVRLVQERGGQPQAVFNPETVPSANARELSTWVNAVSRNMEGFSPQQQQDLTFIREQLTAHGTRAQVPAAQRRQLDERLVRMGVPLPPEPVAREANQQRSDQRDMLRELTSARSRLNTTDIPADHRHALVQRLTLLEIAYRRAGSLAAMSTEDRQQYVEVMRRVHLLGSRQRSTRDMPNLSTPQAGLPPIS